MARKNENHKKATPKEQLDEYKKEIGKKYMDGLISDKEYEKLLRDRENGLGLNAPSVAEQEKGPECPSCGALVKSRDTECQICGMALTPALEVEPEETEVLPPERVCGTCGAVVSDVDTICVVCGSMLLRTDEHASPGELDVLDEKTQDERTCPSCGAFVEPNATECMICETPFEAISAAAVMVPKPEKTETETAPPAKEPIAAAAEEKTCPSCGAVVDPDATECIICETPFIALTPAAPVSIEEAVPEIKVEEPAEEKEMLPKEPEITPEPLEISEPQNKETICAGCGAFLDEGADECFICGTKVGEEPAETPTPVPVTIPKAIPVAEIQKPKPKEVPAPKTEEKVPPKEIVLADNEIMCPSCSSVIPIDSDKCPECWNDLSLYVKCASCSLLTPAGEDNCRECFAALEKSEPVSPIMEQEIDILGLEIPDEVEITVELQEEMTSLEAEEEQGKECLVCGAIFGPEDMLCPICGIEYGINIEEPKMPENSWDVEDIEIAPIIHTCPACGENVTGLEATEREVSEGNWFYRGLIAIFIGIFFTSFSIYARGVSAENASLGLHPPPTDVLLNVLGWILVLVGFLFWLMSWKLHGEKTECPECGIETDPHMAVCINCGNELIAQDDDEPREEDAVDEDLLPEQEDSVNDQYNLLSEKPLQYEIRSKPAEEDLKVPEPKAKAAAPPKPAVKAAPAKTEPAKPVEHHLHGEELPIEHEEHKKCPGCGIFVDIGDTICPICDTEFSVPKPLKDRDIDVPTEEEELANLDAEKDLKVPKESASQIECPSCGASLSAGTKACPVCEYPMDQ